MRCSNHPDVKAVSFVGSTPIAQYIYETGARNGKRVQALGGAKNHMVVMPDADIEQAVDALIGSAYGSAGERCMAISVAVLVGDIADRIVPKLAERARALKVIDPMDLAAEMGPIVTRSRRVTASRVTSAWASRKARSWWSTAGLKVPGLEGGFFTGGTLFDQVKPTMRIYRKRSSARCWPACACRSRHRGAAGQRPRVRQRRGLLHQRRRRGARVLAPGAGGHGGHQRADPVPMAWHGFGGWKRSLFGDMHAYGEEGLRFYTKQRA